MRWRRPGIFHKHGYPEAVNAEESSPETSEKDGMMRGQNGKISICVQLGPDGTSSILEDLEVLSLCPQENRTSLPALGTRIIISFWDCLNGQLTAFITQLLMEGVVYSQVGAHVFLELLHSEYFQLWGSYSLL